MLKALKITVVATLVGLLVIPVGGMATAGSKLVKDRLGDTFGAPSADIRRVSATYGGGRLKVRWNIPRLSSRTSFVGVTPRKAGRRGDPIAKILQLQVRDGRNGVRAGLYRYDQYDGTQQRLKCNGIKARWNERRGFVSASMPKNCRLMWATIDLLFFASARGGGDGARIKSLRYN